MLSDAGCLTDQQHQDAVKALTDYTASLQDALTTAGFYSGAVDGVYGPATVDAVKKLQSAHKLPQTGFVDLATAAALQASLAGKQAAGAAAAIAATTAVQSTLKLAAIGPGQSTGSGRPSSPTR